MALDVKDKKFLVTGGAGFIGSHIVDALVKRGAKVFIIDNLVTGRKENLNPTAKFYNLNITDPKIESIFRKEKPQYIYHVLFYLFLLQFVILMALTSHLLLNN